MFLGEDLLPLLTLAIGGALAVGTVAAFLRPKAEVGEGELARPPLVRSVIQVVIGVVVSVWAVASLFS